MSPTRRTVLGSVGAAAATVGCLGGRSDDGSAASVDLFPRGAVATLDSEVERSAIDDALDGGLGEHANVTHDSRTLGTVTHVETIDPGIEARDLESRLGSAGFDVPTSYTGVGPHYRTVFETALGEQVAGRTDTEPSRVSLSSALEKDEQRLTVSAPTERSALVPTLPVLELRRVDAPADADPIVGRSGISVDSGFEIPQLPGRGTAFQFSLTESGIESFGDAVTAADESELENEFFRPVVDGRSLAPLDILRTLRSKIEEGDWTGQLVLLLPERPAGEEHPIARLTGLPPVPFDCVVDPYQ